MRIEPAIADIEIFRPNSYMENLAKLKTEKPDVFDVLSESEKLTLQIYLEQKMKHEQEKSDDNRTKRI
jgi:hypothetical protein